MLEISPLGCRGRPATGGTELQHLLCAGEAAVCWVLLEPAAREALQEPRAFRCGSVVQTAAQGEGQTACWTGVPDGGGGPVCRCVGLKTGCGEQPPGLGHGPAASGTCRCTAGTQVNTWRTAEAKCWRKPCPARQLALGKQPGRAVERKACSPENVVGGPQGSGRKSLSSCEASSLHSPTKPNIVPAARGRMDSVRLPSLRYLRAGRKWGFGAERQEVDNQSPFPSWQTFGYLLALPVWSVL